MFNVDSSIGAKPLAVKSIASDIVIDAASCTELSVNDW